MAAAKYRNATKMSDKEHAQRPEGKARDRLGVPGWDTNSTLLLPQERKNHLCKGIPNRALLYQTPPLSRVFILFSDAELPQKKFSGVLELQKTPWEGSSPHYNQGQATNRKFVRKSLSTRRKLP